MSGVVPRGRVLGVVALVAVVAMLGVLAVLTTSSANTSPAPAPVSDLEARTLAVERQLLCPQCTNKRLDVCDEAICQDMRREIRARLERGESEPQIVAFFAGRFGDRVLASVPKSGFNLWLWGWVLASMALAGLAAWSWLSRSRSARAKVEADAPELEAAEEVWLDAQLRDDLRSDLEAGTAR